MIISASRRTDIPAYYSEWFLERLRAGVVVIANPMNPRQLRRVNLSPDVVDGIVFWTKNPLPIFDKLEQLCGYPYYFQVTLTPYGREVEPGLPDKKSVIIPGLIKLSERIGPERLIWRYDPIFFSHTYTMARHIEEFTGFANKLNGYTKHCVISFIDDYRHIRRHMMSIGARGLTSEEKTQLAQQLSEIAGRSGISINTCAEHIDLSAYGIGRARCIDHRIFEKQTGQRLSIQKATSQRFTCGCDESIDIGVYDTCMGGFLYCYANKSVAAVKTMYAKYHRNSPILCGQIDDLESIPMRQIRSAADGQTSLFDV